MDIIPATSKVTTAVEIRIILNMPPPDTMLDGGPEPTPREVSEACMQVRRAVNRWLYEE